MYRFKRRPKWLNILGLTKTKEQVVRWRPAALLVLLGLGLVLYARQPAPQDLYNTGESLQVVRG